MKKVFRFCSLVLLCGSILSMYAESQVPLVLVPALNPERYSGLWYEIARYQHSFEKTLVGATAEYKLRPDGKIDVLNSGFKNTLDGKFTSVKAVAWIPNPAIPAALKVKFFNLFFGRLSGIRP